MSNYTITTDFGAKDDLPSGNASKVIKGSEFTTEFTNIKTAINSKADLDAPTFTGATTFSGTVTLNDDVTFDTNTMFVDVSTNRVGIGTTSPTGKLHVYSGSSGATVNSNADDLIIESATNAGISILGDGNETQYLMFGDADNNAIGRLQYSHADNYMGLYTNGSEHMRIDSSGNVGIGTTSPATALDVTGNVTADGLTVDGDATVQSTSGNTSTFLLGQSGVRNWRFQNIATTGELQVKSTPTTTAFEIDTNGDISFYEDTGTTPKLFWDASAERLGIGTNTPSAVLDVVGTKIQLTGANPEIVLNDNTNTNTCIIKNNDGSLDYKADQNNEQGLSRHRFYTDGTQRMEIEANGNVGIGTSSPTHNLHIEDSSTTQIKVKNTTNNAEVRLGSSATGGDGFVGTASADNLSIITNNATRMTVDSSGNVGIGTSSPNSNLELSSATGSATISPTELRITSSTQASDWSTTDSWGVLAFHSSDTSGGGSGNLAEISANMGNSVGGFASIDFTLQNPASSYAHTSWLKLKNSASVEDRFVEIKADGGLYVENNVGIGTTSPKQQLHISGGSSSGDVTKVTIGATGANAETHLQLAENFSGNDMSYGFSFITDGNDTNNLLIKNHNNSTTGTTALSVDRDTGNVGIGTSNPAREFSIGDGTGSPNIQLLAASSGNSRIEFGDTDDSDAGEIQYVHSDNYMQFTTNGSERMRIDSSGNLLVGKTSTAFGTAGSVSYATGLLTATVNGNSCVQLNRLTSDGVIQTFGKDGTTVGSIGTITNRLHIGSGNTFITFYDDGNAIYPAQSNGTLRDNAIDIGTSSGRFDDIYATNGTIQTSDRNEKQDIAELSDAEQRIAVAAKGLLRKFRWRDAVEEKGDEARIHFGIIAQDLQDAFTAEGLDAGDYAMFINSTWTDEETGEERSRMGVRYSELLAFIISAI